nr:PD-(D/E)XK nuclease family transposase [uncultured Agathobacter sp.]
MSGETKEILDNNGVQNDVIVNRLIDNMTLFDDNLMSLVFGQNIEATELLLRVIMERDIEVVSVQGQDEFKNSVIGGRCITLDVHAIDTDGRHIDIEVQINAEGAHVKRARYHSSMMDARMLKEGQEFKEIEDSYVIFIYDHDKFKKGLPFYHIQRRVDETGEVFGDGSHIIYVNGKYNGNDDIGQMMRDFHQCIPEQIKNEILSEAVAYYKGKEGRGVMSDAVREYGEEQKKAGIKEGQLELLVKFFRNNGTEAAAKQMLDASDEDIKIAKERLVSLS